MLKRVKKIVHLPIFLLSLGVVSVVSWGISKQTGYNFWALLVGLYLACALIGLIITSDKEYED